MLFGAVLAVVCCAAVANGVPTLSEGSSRISGGTPALKGEFPWHVSIQQSFPGSNWTHWCDGAIVSTKYVITNGWCPLDRTKSYRVVAGSLDWQRPGSTHEVLNKTTDPTGRDYLSLWHVDPPFQFLTYVAPVRLPSAFVESCPDTAMTVTGWGESKPYVASDALVKLHTLVVSKALCRTVTPWISDFSHLVCAKSSNNQAGFCTHAGGFGAPLVRDAELRGVYYEFAPCDQPVAFAEVSHFRDWIHKVTGV